MQSQQQIDLLKEADINMVATKGQDIYEKIKQKFTAGDKGKFLAIEINTGEDFIDEDSMGAYKKGAKKYPESIFYMVKIGYKACESLGGVLEEED